MKVIYSPRMAGKTTELIKLASEGRYKLIVCQSRSEVDRVWKLILQLKKDGIIENTPPQPITYEEFLERKYAVGRNIEEFLIDNVDIFLQSLTPVKIGAISLTKD